MPVIILLLFISFSFVAQADSTAIFRVDGVLSGPGGGPWGEGGTKIEPSGASASFGSNFGVAAAVEVKVFNAVWVEFGVSRSDSVGLEIIRSHGIGNPFDTYNGKISVASYMLGVDFRPHEWEVGSALQYALFAKYVSSQFGAPPPAAAVILDTNAAGFCFGLRADYALHNSSWLVGMDFAFGGAAPTIADPAANTSRKVEIGNFYLAVGPRFNF